MRFTLQRQRRLQQLLFGVRGRPAELQSEVHERSELLEQRGVGEGQQQQWLLLHVPQRMERVNMCDMSFDLQFDAGLRGVRGRVCELPAMRPHLHEPAGLQQKRHLRERHGPELPVHVSASVQQQHGMLDVCSRPRAISRVLPDVHIGDELQRERSKRQRQQQHWMQLHVSEQLGYEWHRCAVLVLRSGVQRFDGLLDVRGRKWQLPDLRAYLHLCAGLQQPRQERFGACPELHMQVPQPVVRCHLQ